jgi:hypothetical protein
MSLIPRITCGMSKTHEQPPPKAAILALAEADLPISAATLRRYLAAGKVRGQRIGERWYTTAEDIRDALVQRVKREGVV